MGLAFYLSTFSERRITTYMPVILPINDVSYPASVSAFAPDQITLHVPFWRLYEPERLMEVRCFRGWGQEKAERTISLRGVAVGCSTCLISYNVFTTTCELFLGGVQALGASKANPSILSHTRYMEACGDISYSFSLCGLVFRPRC